MILNWVVRGEESQKQDSLTEQIPSNSDRVLSATTDPFKTHIELQGAWQDVREKTARLFRKTPWSTVLSREMTEDNLRFDRFSQINPLIEFRVSPHTKAENTKDQNTRRQNPDVPTSKRSEEAAQGSPTRRVDLFLHLTPTIPLGGKGTDREVISLADSFHFLAWGEDQAKTLSQMMADILPGTSIASPPWVLELDYKLSVERSDLSNLLVHSDPSVLALDCVKGLEEEFLLAVRSARWAEMISRREGVLNPQGFVLHEGFKKGFNIMAASGRINELRCAIMVQNALMSHALNVACTRTLPPVPGLETFPGMGSPT